MSIRKLLLLVLALVVAVGASVRCYLDGEEAVRAATQPRVLPQAPRELEEEAPPTLRAFPAFWEGSAERPQARRVEPPRPPSSPSPGAAGAPETSRASPGYPWATCQKAKTSCAPPPAPLQPPAAGAFVPDPGAM